MLRNQANKIVEFVKHNYFVQRLGSVRNIWREFRSYKGEEDNGTPTKIIHNNKEVASPKKMSNIFNEFFIKKVEDIQSKFDEEDSDQMEILSKLIPRPNTTLDINYVTINEVYDAVIRMKTTNSCGFDQINSKTMKMIPQITTLWLTHLINSMLLKQKFPKILKVSKITPIKKSKKCPMTTASYRPISNLQVYEKVVEEVLKRRLTKYFEDNNLLSEEHHGGRRYHSTVSAMSILEEAARRNLDKNKLGIIISTDLQAAFDTVNSRLLIQKLKYYGISGNLIKLLESYLKDRYQFVEIQNVQSKILQSPNCSVI